MRRLRRLTSDEDVKNLYRWFWDNDEAVAETAREINEAVGLVGEHELKPDLPCLTVGSRKGLLILAANPSWKCDLKVAG